MLKKKIEIVELNKKEEKIVLEEKKSALAIFLKKNGLLVFLTALILSLTILICGLYMLFTNMYESKRPIINKVSVNTSLTEYQANISAGNISFTDEDAKNAFQNNKKFKANGEALLVNTVEHHAFTLKYYSDGMALKIMKKSNFITKITPLENGDYGISKNGTINSKAKYIDIKERETKTYPWGMVTYYNDGSAIINNSKIDLFVRNSSDIKEEYISNNKVSYLKETKNYGKIKLNYYHDETIEVVINDKSYVIRNEKDIKIEKNNVTFINNNQAKISKKFKTKDGLTIDYYEDGGAIIRNGTRTLSVRKSNSIIIKNDKIYEIIDNNFVEISKKTKEATYYTNGSAVVKYNGQTLYIEDNSNILYENGNITNVGQDKEVLINESNIANENVKIFEKTAIVKTEKYIAIVPKDNVVLDEQGKIKEIVSVEDDINNEFTITNNTNEVLKYRVVIEESPKTNLDTQYIRYQISTRTEYNGPNKLNSNLWNNDYISNQLKITGKNYILLDSTIEPFDTENIKIMLWTDYKTIPNSMQNKYFYGTIKIYAWTEE